MEAKLKIDNVFIAESPLQALVALELSLNFPDEKNAIIYRITGREINDKQIQQVINCGNWSHKDLVIFDSSSRIKRLLNSSKFYRNLKSNYQGVSRTFFGEFRSEWMHLSRLIINASNDYLMDDGAATVYVKKEFIDKGIFFPEKSLFKVGFISAIFKKIRLAGLVKRKNLNYPFNFASAFVHDKNGFNIDFQNIKNKFKSQDDDQLNIKKKIYFFGSKLSEVNCVSIEYELNFLSRVLRYYEKNNLEIVYCAHRDESPEKLNRVIKLGFFEVLSPSIPSELFFLTNSSLVSEFGSALSSVLNNLNLIFPEIKITSFELDCQEIPANFVSEVNITYDHYRKLGIEVINI